MNRVTKTLLRIEEKARTFFERMPFVQAFIAGAGAIIFWRGIWELLDSTGVSPWVSIVIGSLLLGSVGLFIQTFIGNMIIIRNVEQEGKEGRRALRTVEGEEVTLESLARKIDSLTEIVSKK